MNEKDFELKKLQKALSSDVPKGKTVKDVLKEKDK